MNVCSNPEHENQIISEYLRGLSLPQGLSGVRRGTLLSGKTGHESCGAPLLIVARIIQELWKNHPHHMIFKHGFRGNRRIDAPWCSLRTAHPLLRATPARRSSPGMCLRSPEKKINSRSQSAPSPTGNWWCRRASFPITGSLQSRFFSTCLSADGGPVRTGAPGASPL